MGSNDSISDLKAEGEECREKDQIPQFAQTQAKKSRPPEEEDFEQKTQQFSQQGSDNKGIHSS